MFYGSSDGGSLGARRSPTRRPTCGHQRTAARGRRLRAGLRFSGDRGDTVARSRRPAREKCDDGVRERHLTTSDVRSEPTAPHDTSTDQRPRAARAGIFHVQCRTLNSGARGYRPASIIGRRDPKWTRIEHGEVVVARTISVTDPPARTGEVTLIRRMAAAAVDAAVSPSSSTTSADRHCILASLEIRRERRVEPAGNQNRKLRLADQAVADGDAHRVRAVVSVKLHPKLTDARLDRLWRDVKPLSNLFVHEPVRYQLKHLGLTPRQLQLEAG